MEYAFNQEGQQEQVPVTSAVKTPKPVVGPQGSVDNLPRYAGQGKKVFSVATSGKYVALTFDDGPHATHTPRILDILKKYNAKATFFVMGPRVQSSPAIISRAIAEGHEVGVHTWSHPQLTKLPATQVRSEMERTISAITQACGVKPVTMRPPYGSVNARLVDFFAGQYGMSTIMWSVDTEDWRKPGKQAIINQAVGKARPGSIILMHDIHGTSFDAVEDVVSGLIANGYQLVTVSQLMAMQAVPKAEPLPMPTLSPQPEATMGGSNTPNSSNVLSPFLSSMPKAPFAL